MGFDPTAVMIVVGGTMLGVMMTLAIVRGLMAAAASELTTFRPAVVAYSVFVFAAIFVSACAAADGGPPDFRDLPQHVILEH